MQIESLVVEGRKIDLEVAGMNNDAYRRLDGQRHAIDKRVRHANGLDGERPDGELDLGLDFDQFDLIRKLVLFQLVVNVGQRELGAVYGNLQLVEDPWQAANMVFVAVREHNAADVLLVLDQVGDVGNNNVNAQQLRLREHQAAVNDNNVVFPTHCQAVHSELAKTTQGDNLQFFCLHRSISMLSPAASLLWDAFRAGIR